MPTTEPTGPVRMTPGPRWDEPGEPYAAVAETHISTVVFIGDRAYKIKKPVAFPFLDLTTQEAREADCAREVDLNRRLAPDVYLGVAYLTAGGQAVGHAGGDPVSEGGDAEPVVVMRRMPAHRRLSTLVRADADVADALRDAARRLAEMHAKVPPLTSVDLGERMRELWDEGFDQLEPFAGRILDRNDLSEARRLAHEYVAGREPLFSDRRKSGRVKDGHGDLLADDVFCLADGVRILDCLEFDPRLRVGDVLADVGFLAMDLERLGRPGLARDFLTWYAEFAAETHPRSLEHHYIAYRAFVRAKVECLRAAQVATDGEEAASAAQAYLRLVLDHLRAGRVRLLLLGGLPGSGKSTLAAELAARSSDGWTLLRSDVVRKEQAWLAPTDSAASTYGTGLYDAAHTDAAYGEMLHRAGDALERGLSVVLDASWTDERHRQRAREVGRSRHAAVTEALADAPPQVCAQRLAHRRTHGSDASDASVEVLARMAASSDPWPTARRILTTGPLDDSVAELQRVALQPGEGSRP
ncbi:MAG: AAA family ATPase [Actinomycetes bacterium]